MSTIENKTVVASEFLKGTLPTAALVAKGGEGIDFSGYNVEGEGTLFVFENDLYITNAETITRIVSASGAKGAYLDGTEIAGLKDGGNVESMNGGVSILIGATFANDTTARYLTSSTVIGVDAVFSGNAGSNGGAFRSDYAQNVSDLSGLDFIGNGNSLGSGGAFYANGSTISGENLYFKSNSVGYWGGAVHISNAGKVVLYNSVFEKNYAKSGGGALDVYKVDSTAELYGATFTGNTSANNEGSAIYNLGTVIVGKNGDRENKFIDNKTNVAIGNMGGATLTIGNAYFSGNAGAIYNAGTVTVNGLITLATAADKISGNGTFTIDYDKFLSATQKIGKVIDTQAALSLPSFALTGSDLGYNVTTATIDGDLFVVKDGVETYTPIVSAKGDVYQAVSGGVEYFGNGYTSVADALKSSSTVVLSDFTASRLTPSKAVTIIGAGDAKFALNYQSAEYGAAISTSYDLNVSNVTFTGNTATRGGAICLDKGAGAVFANVIFTGNTATQNLASGLLINQIGANKEVKITDSVFKDNVGGAIYNNSSKLTVEKCVFSGNTSPEIYNGNCIHVGGATSSTYVIGSTFTGNLGQREVLHVNDGKVFVSASTDGKKTVFADNKCVAIQFAAASVTAEISDAVFNSNIGGAIDNRGTLSISNTEFLTINDSIYNIGTVNFSGNITLCGSLSGTGKWNFAAGTVVTLGGNKRALGNADFSNALIKVDGALYEGEAVIVAEKVGKIGKFEISDNPFLTLTIDGTNLVLKEIEAQITEKSDLASYTGTGVTIMEGGKVSGAFIAQKTTDADTIATKITGGSLETNTIAGAFAKAADLAENTVAEIGNTELNIGGEADVKGQVYAGGYFYGTGTESTEAQMTVSKVNIKLDGNAKVNGNLYAGIHARAAANVKVNEIAITVKGGEHDRIYAGGWAEGKSYSEVGKSTVTVSGGKVNFIYGGGATGGEETSTYVGATTITVGANAEVGTIFMSGRYGYSSTGAVELNWYGQNDMKRLSGVSSAGIDNANSTTVNLFADMTVDTVDYVDTFVFAEGKKLTVNDEFLLGDRTEAGLAEGVTTFDFQTDGFEGDWEAIAGISDFTNAQFAINGIDVEWDGTAAKVINGYELSYNETNKTVTLKQLA